MPQLSSFFNVSLWDPLLGFLKNLGVHHKVSTQHTTYELLYGLMPLLPTKFIVPTNQTFAKKDGSWMNTLWKIESCLMGKKYSTLVSSIFLTFSFPFILLFLLDVSMIIVDHTSKID
jgi:hypothetical protein